ncbi:MAG: serine hydrolase [Pseudomonadota bacterium]
MTDLMNAFPPAPEAQVTLANWRTRPFNAWAFHHVREVVPSADIPHDPGKVQPFLEGPQVTPDGLEDFLRDGEVDGLVVLHQGAIILERYGNGMGPRDPHILMSVSKSLLGLLAGVLSEQGVLNLDAAAETYVPELTQTAFAGAAVQQLLDMRTGITFNEDYLITEGPIVEYRKATNWNPLGPGEVPSDLRTFLLSLTETDEPHGGVFDYKSPCTDLLGWIIERATGKRYADVFAQEIWSKIGAETPAYITVDRLGAPRTAGGMCVTTRDLARVGQVLVEDGAGVIPKPWIEDIESNGDPAAWDGGAFAPDFPGMPMHYRSKWYVLRDRGPILFCIGIHGQNLLVDRKAGLVLARHSSLETPLDPASELKTIALFERIRDMVA